MGTEKEKRELREGEKICREVVQVKIVVSLFENKVKMQENRVKQSMCQKNRVSGLSCPNEWRGNHLSTA